MTTRLTTHQSDLRRFNRSLNTDTVCKRLCAAVPRLAQYAYIVGVWVWIETDEKPSEDERTELKVLGFSWNKNRGAWQHPCGEYRRTKRGFNPRHYYEEKKVTA